MNALTIDAKGGKYPYYLIEDTFLDLLIKLEGKSHFSTPEKAKDICFVQLNQISENILRGIGNEKADYITGILDKFIVKNIKLNSDNVSSETLFWCTYAYLNFRYDPTQSGKDRLEKKLEEHLMPEVIFDLLEPYRIYKF